MYLEGKLEDKRESRKLLKEIKLVGPYRVDKIETFFFFGLLSYLFLYIEGDKTGEKVHGRFLMTKVTLFVAQRSNKLPLLDVQHIGGIHLQKFLSDRIRLLPLP